MIKQPYPEYELFYSPSFDGKSFLQDQENFSTIDSIESVKIFEQKDLCNPLITIAIPTYKRIDTFVEALNSALCQKTDKWGGGMKLLL